MDKKWTLVTGASGFIGARLARRLVERGEHVKGFVRPGANLSELGGLPRERFRLAYGDIRVQHTIYRALIDCQRIYHVASPFSLSGTESDIVGTAVQGTEAVLEAGRRQSIRRYVITSSAAVLGVNESAQPMDEEHEFNLASVYPRSKQLAEERAFDLADDHGLDVVAVNPAAVAGPGDWRPTPNGAAIVQYLKLAGSWRVPHGEGGFNVVDVDDVVEGHILAMDKGLAGERYILGGDNLTYEQFFKILSDLTGLYPPGKQQSKGTMALMARLMEMRAWLGGDPPVMTAGFVEDFIGRYSWVSSRKAEEQLGYSHRPARETLARAVRWFLAQGYVPRRAARRVRPELRMA